VLRLGLRAGGGVNFRKQNGDWGLTRCSSRTKMPLPMMATPMDILRVFGGCLLCWVRWGGVEGSL